MDPSVHCILFYDRVSMIETSEPGSVTGRPCRLKRQLKKTEGNTLLKLLPDWSVTGGTRAPG